MSFFPSRSISLTETPTGFPPVVRSILEASEIEPDVLWFWKTETDAAPLFVTIISFFPSPSISAMSMPTGLVPAVKSTLVAKEPVNSDPDVLIFLKTEIVLPFWLVTTISGFPSVSMSPIARKVGVVPVIRSALLANEEASIAWALVNVTLKGFDEYAVNPLTVTVMGWYVEPGGTVTVS